MQRQFPCTCMSYRTFTADCSPSTAQLLKIRAIVKGKAEKITREYLKPRQDSPGDRQLAVALPPKKCSSAHLAPTSGLGVDGDIDGGDGATRSPGLPKFQTRRCKDNQKWSKDIKAPSTKHQGFV